MYKDKEKERENDRKQSRVKYARYKQKRSDLIEKFGGKCWGCERQNCQFHFHHTVNGMHGKYGHASSWRRKQQISEVEMYPDIFKMLCPSCHNIVTQIELNRNLDSTQFIQKLQSIARVL